MNQWERPTRPDRGRRQDSFRGTILVTTLCQEFPGKFGSRYSATRFARELFRQGALKGLYGTSSFEDTDQLYAWGSLDPQPVWQNRNGIIKHLGNLGPEVNHASDAQILKTVKEKLEKSGPKSTEQIYSSNKLADEKIYYSSHQSLRSQTEERKVTSQKVSVSRKLFEDQTYSTNTPSKRSVDSEPYYSNASVTKPLSDVEYSASNTSVKKVVDYVNTKTYSIPDKNVSVFPSQADYVNQSELKRSDINHICGLSGEKLSRGNYVNSRVITRHSKTRKTMSSASPHDNLSAHDDGPPTDRTEGNSIEMELLSTPRSKPEVPAAVSTATVSNQWQPDSQYCYSDNEKQLIEEMSKMKSEHEVILMKYEQRISKLMNRMHELKGIAEMLENTGSTGTKTSPYGALPSSASMLNFLGAKLEQERRQASEDLGVTGMEGPPPLPPRPGRGPKAQNTKPPVNPRLKLKKLEWTRLVVKDAQDNSAVWHSMTEPKVEGEEIERLFRNVEDTGGSLYDDISKHRGSTKTQLMTLIDVEKSRRAVYTMKSLPCTLDDVTTALSVLDTSHINSDRFAELLELIGAGNDMDKVTFHVRRKSADSLDYPDFLLLKLSKIKHCRERIDFLRFRYRIQWHLFETEQQLKELHTACHEVVNSVPLKHLLETLLAVGNYLNGGTEHGQADGYKIQILNKLKEIHDSDGKGNLLEFVLKLYCMLYEVDIEMACPTRFRLPEPSNMRHAAQVSFEHIADALSNMKAEIKSTREKFLAVSTKEKSEPKDALWTKAENFMTAALEMVSEEEKVLFETKQLFGKTVTYFFLDYETMSPQQFFQIWAVFLHDCKYYWKLAHRKLGKERFEIDFRHRGNMPMVSIQGYDTFRDNMTKRLKNLRDPSEPNSSTLEHPRKSGPAPAWSSQEAQETPLGTSSLTGSVGASDVKGSSKLSDVKGSSKLSDVKGSSKLFHTGPSSPKALTAEPPSELHKPLAKTPVSSTNSVAEEETTMMNNNYENHLGLEKAKQVNVVQATPISGSISGPVSGSIAGTMSKPVLDLNNSLLGPQGNVVSQGTCLRYNSRLNVDSDDKRSVSASQSCPVTNPSSSSTSTFSKLRSVFLGVTSGASAKSVTNTMSTAGSASREPMSMPVTMATKECSSVPSAYVPPHIPLRVTVQEGEISPYETSLGRESTRHAPYRIDQRYATHTGGTNPRDHHGRYEVGRTPVRSKPGRTGTTDYAQLYHTPPFESLNIDKDGYSSPTVLRQQIATKSDINNNTPVDNSTADGSAKNQQLEINPTTGPVRTRAPLVLGSNVSISEAYPQGEREQGPHVTQKHVDFDLTPSVFTPQTPVTGSVNRSTAAQPLIGYNTNMGGVNSVVGGAPAHLVNNTPIKIPSYNALRVHNYENQGRLEKPAQAVRHRADPVFMTPSQAQKNLNLNSHDTFPKASRSHVIPKNPTGSLQNTPVKDGTGSNAREHAPVDGATEVKNVRNPPVKPSRNLNFQFQEALRADESKYKSPTLANVNPLSSLISKFEKSKTTSVALEERRSRDEETPPPLPPPPIPPRADQSFQDNYPTDSLDSRSSRGKRDRLKDLPKTLNNSFHDDVKPVTSPLGTPGKPQLSREDTGLSDQAESYKDKLRKVAANSSVLDRFSRQFTPQHPKSSSVTPSGVQFSTPQYNRQNSASQSVSTQSYSRQSSLSQSQAGAATRPNGFIPQLFSQSESSTGNKINNLVQASALSAETRMPKVSNITNAQMNSFHGSQFNDVTSPILPPKNSPFLSSSNDRGTDERTDSEQRTAVVSPTVRHQGSVTYMDI